MKKLLALILVACALNSYAQLTTTPNVKLDENAVVKDANGTSIPYATWQKLMLTGEYQLRRSSGKTEFVIHKMTAEEKARMDERRKSLNANLPKPRPTTSFKDGEKFAGYKLTDIEGNKYDIKDAKGKIIVLNFWFINCPPCKQEIPELNKLQARYKDSTNVLFLGIALDEKDDLKEFLKTTPFTYNIVHDGRFYAEKHKITGYPTHVVIGKDGLVKFHTLGLAQNTIEWVEKTIKEELIAP